LVKLSEPAPTTRDALQLFKGCFDILRGTNSVKLGLRERQECALVTGIERSTKPSNGGPMFAHVLIAAREVVRSDAVAEPEGRTIEARSFRQTGTVAGTAGEPVRRLSKLMCIRRSASCHDRYSTSDHPTGAAGEEYLVTVQGLAAIFAMMSVCGPGCQLELRATHRVENGIP
jgi:hypothetical protein